MKTTNWTIKGAFGIIGEIFDGLSHADRAWNARLERRGQSHSVEVYRLIARHTIDEQIAKRCGQKVTAQQLILDYFA